MKRFLKILLAVAGVFVVLIVVAMITLPLFFDPNDYRAQIDTAIQDQIGRAVTIDGDIGLSVFPWLGIELGHVEVANAQDFGDKPMAEMQSADVSVRLLPLLSRHIEIGTVSLDGLNLRLARNKQGRTNWADITEHLAANQDGDTQPVPNKPSEPAAKSGDGGFDLSSLQIGAIEVRDAGVSWRDATTGADYSASGVKLTTGRLTDGEPVRLEFGGDFAAPGEKLNGKVHLVARVQPDFSESFYRFSDLNLNVLASGDAVPAGRQQASLTGQGELDAGAGSFKLSNLSLQAAGLNVSGAVDANGLNGKPSYSGRITVQNFDPKTVMRELAIETPATQNDDVLSSAGFDAQFNASNDAVQFKQVLATLDDSTLKGTARVEHFDKPAVGFDLHLDKLDVDGYLPPGSAEQAETEKPAPSGGGDAQKQAEIDLSALKDLRLDGKLAVGSLTAANIHVSNADLTVKARNGVLTIEPLTADLYDGNLRLTARVDASKDTPRYALKGNLDGLQFAQLLKDVAGTDRVSALAKMNVDLTTSGKQVASMKRALSGNLGFDLRDGAFNGFNLARIIDAARTRLGDSGAKASASGTGASEKTPFNRLAANFNVNKGVLAGKDLKLDTRLIDAQGAGNYDLAKNALDYTVNATVSKDASGTLEKLAGVTVPIQLTGNLLSPDYRLDIAGALKGVANQRLEAEKSKLQDKVRKKLQERGKGGDDDLGNKVQQGLKGLFGGKKGDNGD